MHCDECEEARSSHRINALILAHLSDSHLLSLAHAPSAKDLIVSAGRSMNAQARYDRFKDALVAAKREGADHVVVTGDLAETGSLGQYEAAAQAFAEARIDPSRVTLLPGNHDRYHQGDAWDRAMRGPLRAFAETSAHRDHMAVVELGATRLVAVDATLPQSIFRSRGELREASLMSLSREVAHANAHGKHTVVALHHPPMRLTPDPWHFWNGLDGAYELALAADAWPHVSFLHGHAHRAARVRFGAHTAFCVHAAVAAGERSLGVYSQTVRDGAVSLMHEEASSPRLALPARRLA